MSDEQFRNTAWLHIYGQGVWHDSVQIGGTRSALMAMKSAIDAALESGLGEARAFATDGEGYAIDVVLMTAETAMKMSVPYTDEIARDGRTDRFGPWTLLARIEAPEANTTPTK